MFSFRNCLVVQSVWLTVAVTFTAVIHRYAPKGEEAHPSLSAAAKYVNEPAFECVSGLSARTVPDDSIPDLLSILSTVFPPYFAVMSELVERQNFSKSGQLFCSHFTEGTSSLGLLWIRTTCVEICRHTTRLSELFPDVDVFLERWETRNIRSEFGAE